MSRANLKSWLGGWQEWGSIILLFLTLEVAVRSIEQVRWITPQPSLTVVLILAVLTGWILHKSRLPGMVTYSLAAVLGALVVVWQASNLLPPLETASGLNQVIVALQSWWQATSVAEPSEGTIHFAMFLIFFTWVIGYISVWFILRRQNAWVAVSLGAVIILVNLSNLPKQHYTFLFFYILAAMLLVGQTSLVRHYYWFKKHGINYSNRGIAYFMVSVLCLSLLAVSVAWRTPEIRVHRLETMISTQVPLRKNIEGYFMNFLAAVRAKQPFLRSSEQRTLFFGDSFGLGDQLQFIIISEQPSYWRARMYDIYSARGWTSSNATEHRYRQGNPGTETERASKRREMTYTVVPKLKTDILLTAGEFISSDTPVSVQLLAPPSFDIDLLHPSDDRALPPDVASLARSLRAVQAENRGFSPDELGQLLPEDLMLTGIGSAGYSPSADDDTVPPVLDSTQLTTIEVTRVRIGERDIVAVTTPRLFRPEQRYRVTSSISTATPADLSEAGDSYPHWVTDYYLQLPPAFPERVRQLSKIVTRSEKSPYDKALVIKRYLSLFNYSLEVEAPPQGVDGVDYFLFSKLSGNCVQFASAMVVMLRSVGVPSRLSIGYSPGEWDASTGSVTLRAKQRHAWPEVYFPGYGWVEFEATPFAGSEFEAVSLTDSEDESLSPDEDWEEDLEADIADKDLDTSGGGAPFRNWSGLTLLLAIIGIILLMFALRSIFYRWLWHFAGPYYASEVYGKMCFLASLVKLSPKPQQTPLEYCAKLVSVFPLQAEAFDNIVQVYLESRFSRRKVLGTLQKGRIQKSWREVYSVFLKRLFHIRY